MNPPPFGPTLPQHPFMAPAKDPVSLPAFAASLFLIYLMSTMTSLKAPHTLLLLRLRRLLSTMSALSTISQHQYVIIIYLNLFLFPLLSNFFKMDFTHGQNCFICLEEHSSSPKLKCFQCFGNSMHLVLPT